MSTTSYFIVAFALVGIVGDKTIHLSGYVSEKKYPEDLRLIEFYDAEKMRLSPL